MALSGEAYAELADAIAAVATQIAETYVVYREDLADGEEPAQALADGFGGEAGDEVVEIRLASRPGEWVVRRWRLGEAA
jgi:hypothetical protein